MLKWIFKMLSKNIHFKTMIFSLIKEHENYHIVNEQFKELDKLELAEMTKKAIEEIDKEKAR